MVSSWESRQTFSTRKKKLIAKEYGSIRFSAVPNFNNVEFEKALRDIIPQNTEFYGRSLESPRNDGPNPRDQTSVVTIIIHLPDASDWEAVIDKLNTAPWRSFGPYVKTLDFFRPDQLEQWLEYQQEFMDGLNGWLAEDQIEGAIIGSPLMRSCLDPGHEYEE